MFWGGDVQGNISHPSSVFSMTAFRKVFLLEVKLLGKKGLREFNFFFVSSTSFLQSGLFIISESDRSSSGTHWFGAAPSRRSVGSTVTLSLLWCSTLWRFFSRTTPVLRSSVDALPLMPPGDSIGWACGLLTPTENGLIFIEKALLLDRRVSYSFFSSSANPFPEARWFREQLLQLGLCLALFLIQCVWCWDEVLSVPGPEIISWKPECLLLRFVWPAESSPVWTPFRNCITV